MSLWYYLLRFKNKIDNYYSRIDSCDKTNSLAFPKSKGHSVVSNSLRPHGLYSPWNSPGQHTGVGSLSLLQGDLPNPGIEPRSPTLQADSLPTKPQGKPQHFLKHFI